MKKNALIIITLICFSVVLFADDEFGLRWPKEIVKDRTTITLYQPQYDSFINNMLEGRMALSVKQKDSEPVFGALFFKARLVTDIEERTAVLEKLDIEKIVFPGIEDTAKIESFSRLLIEEIESWDVVMSLDRITASLNEVEDLKALSVNLNNKPPDIYFRSEPSVLVSIDGDPILKQIDNSEFKYVVNTAFFIVKYRGKYYIKGGKFWYISNDVVSGYKYIDKVPSDIEKFAKQNLPDEELDSISKSINEAPSLIVVTKPSELIITDGNPDYTSIKGTTLLYVSNTTNDILMDISSQNHYILIAGRWYYSKSLNDGDWKFAEPDKLPGDFTKIPEDSEMSNVRASVPGTSEAKDALLEQSIPQTATVDRKTAKLEVRWDGDPKFEKIKDTEILIAKNCDKTVLLIQNKYYCVDDAIWFVADKPVGPWAVSDIRPKEVDQIPPESEAYNVKYVYIYESTPEVVYVGYLPGYNWSYVYGGCVVYGTGYWYRPWYSYYYYPRPVTWGYGVHWNPWTGWGFSYGYSYGWVGWGFHPYSRAYWGPRGYYAGYRHGYHRGYHHGYNQKYAHRARASYAPGSRNSNVYKNRPTGVKTTNARTAQANRNLNNKARPSAKPNNVYSDRSGNVYQRDKSGNWENKNNNRPSQQPSNQQRNVESRDRANQQPSTQQQNRTQQSSGSNMSSQQRQQMNQSYQNRNRGTQNYNRSSSYNRSSGASRSAGGRRR